VSKPERSKVLTVRVTTALDRRIQQEAERKRQTRSAVLRDALQRAFGEGPDHKDQAQEAHRQSLLVSDRASERDSNAFISSRADTRRWK